MRVTKAIRTAQVGFVSLVLVMVWWIAYRLAPESTPVARGAAYAGIGTCIGCHGDPANPQADANDEHCSDFNTMAWHPDYDVVCSDVMAYFKVVGINRTFDERRQTSPDNPLIAGESLARKFHCFQCHGPLGQGGFKNEKSLKGYVPGYFGNDFVALTRNADPVSVREWIVSGSDSAMVDKPITGNIAKFFLDRQAVRMPSFASLTEKEIDVLVSYVIALHQYGSMNARVVRSYDERSQLLP